MSSGPIIQMMVGANTADANQKLAALGAKAQETASKVSGAFKSQAANIGFTRTSGLLTDPAGVMQSSEREAEMARRRAVAMAQHEVWLKKKNAATAAAAAEEKAIYGGIDKAMSKRSAQAALNKEMGFIPLAGGAEKVAAGAEKATRGASALGGAVKMMAGFMTVDFLAHQGAQIIEYGGHVQDTADRLGISAQGVQLWDYALKQNGGTMDDARRFFELLAKSRDKALKGNEAAITSFQHLGVSMEQLKTGRLEDIGAQIGKVFEGGADPQQFMADLRAVGGKSAGEMVATFAAGLENMFTEARTASTVMSDEVIASLDKIGDTWTRIGMQMKSALAPAIAGMGDLVEFAMSWARYILAGVVGFGSGQFSSSVDILKDVLSGDFIKAGKDLFKAPAAGVKGAISFVSDYNEGVKLEQKAAEDAKAAKEAAMKARSTTFDAEDVKGKKAKEKLEGRLKSQIDKKEERNTLELLDEDQKRHVLLQKRRLVEQEIADLKTKGDTTGALKAQSELADVDKELIHLDKQDRAETVKLMKPTHNALQQMGGFLGNFSAAAPITPAEQATIKSQGILEKMLRIMERKDTESGTNTDDVVDFA